MNPRVLVLQLGFFVALFGLWQIASDHAWVDPAFLPSPATILVHMRRILATADFWREAEDTGIRVLAAFAIGAPCGLLAGFALGSSARMRQALSGLFNLVLAVPQSIFLPIFILLLGLGFTEKLVFGLTHVFFVVAVTTAAAVREVPASHVLAARSFGASQARIYRSIYLPAMAPQIVNGLRLGLIFTVIGILLAEMYGSQTGLGILIFHWGEAYQVPDLLAGTMIISIVTVLANEAMRLWEGRVSRWRAT